MVLVPDVAGCGVCSKAGVGPLVSGAGSRASRLRGPKCVRAGISLLVGGTGAQGFPELVPAH